ncbi:hypothetical protein [Haloferula rosea]|uniref:Uncharacterized protein n=1 Tax=Haloferula rosea TaxID=490093 RepID=A0A934RAT1_9BACT|nr:hypothetical protein [Haloferula rosea]MBK1826197.1 hypothetical protein [Haloferula rosea]
MKVEQTESRGRQIVLGSLVIAAVGLFLILCWFGRHIPGMVGEWFGMIVGVATSPFLMPVCFVLLGFFVVNTLNAWRRHREGEECVYLESVDGPERETLPEQARDAIYTSPPLPAEVPDELTQLEGALAIGDHDAAVDLLASMTNDLRESPQVIQLRIELAQATGKTDLANRLRERLNDAS